MNSLESGSQIWQSLIDEGSAIVDIRNVDELERQITKSLLDEKEADRLEATPYLARPISGLLYPKGFIGSITSINIELSQNPSKGFQNHSPGRSALIEQIEQLDFSVGCKVTGYGEVGIANISVWYYLASKGSWNEPSKYKLRRKSTPIAWTDHSQYPTLLNSLRKSAGANLVGGKVKHYVKKGKDLGDHAQQVES
jgi:hypothetical protein